MLETTVLSSSGYVILLSNISNKNRGLKNYHSQDYDRHSLFHFKRERRNSICKPIMTKPTAEYLKRSFSYTVAPLYGVLCLRILVNVRNSLGVFIKMIKANFFPWALTRQSCKHLIFAPSITSRIFFILVFN